MFDLWRLRRERRRVFFEYEKEIASTGENSPEAYQLRVEQHGDCKILDIMLNGTYDLPSQGQYWGLLVNSVYASAGIDLTTLNPGDLVEFVNEPYAAKHAATAVEFRHK